MMEVKLVVASGRNAGQVIPVSGGKFFIGRAEDCNLRPYSDLISRHHCAILVDQGSVLVRDFGSKNGTVINGERVRTEQELKNGDRLQVGDLEFEVQLIVELPGKKLSKVHGVQEVAARTAEVGDRSTKVADDDLELLRLMSDDTGTLAADSETRTIHASRSKKSVASPPATAKVSAAKPAKPAATPAVNQKQARKRTEEKTAEEKAAEERAAEQKAAEQKAAANRFKPKLEGPSSQDAAAAMLKNFFKGL